MHTMRVALLLLGLLAVNAKIYFKEDFNDDGWKDRWVISEHKPSHERGAWKHTAGKWYGDENDKGLQTGEDARFYQTSSKLEELFDNTGKDLVLQFSVKHEQDIDCGGGYIKLLPEGVDQSSFHGDSPYEIMFGPDICGPSNRRAHAILSYKGNNLLIKEDVKCEKDKLTHLYTLVIKSDNTFKIMIDQKTVKSGSLYDNWDFLPPKTIRDPEAKKPADWVDEATIPDPEDKKPEDWDDVPEKIPDPTAEKPQDWNEEEDGEWEPPLIDNPEYKGEWKPRTIPNPEFKGKWEAPRIPNPDYFEDESVYRRNPIQYVGFEIWQVKSGSIFDDIILSDSEEEVQAYTEQTYSVKAPKEKEMYDRLEEEKRQKQEEERKRQMEESKNDEDHEEDEEDDEDEDKDEL